MRIGKIIRAYRAKHKILQSDMSKILGITKATLCRVESGENDVKGEVLLKALDLIVPEVSSRLNELDLESCQVLEKNHEWLTKWSNNKGL